MVGDLLKIEASQARESGPRIRIAGARQHGQNLHGLFQFRGEDLGIVTMLEPPLPLPADVRSWPSP